MFRKKNKDNNSSKAGQFKTEKKKGWFFWTMFGFYLFKKIRSFKQSGKMKDIEHNFKEFLHKENKEIKEYTHNKENISEFVADSNNIFKDYFIPHSGNNHMPKILRTKSLAIMALVAVLLKFSVVAYLYFIFPNSSKADADMVAKILALVNRDRSAESLATLSLNPVLSNSALAKANDIISKDYFAHVSPDGKKPWDWIDRGQYAYALVGENLAMNFTTAESAHRALMNSPSHKRNIMNKKYSDIGLAIVSGEIAGKKTNVLVQMFSTQVKRPVFVQEVEASKKIADTQNIVSTQTKKISEPEVIGNINQKNIKVLSATNDKVIEKDKQSEVTTPKKTKTVEPVSKAGLELIAKKKLAVAKKSANLEKDDLSEDGDANGASAQNSAEENVDSEMNGKSAQNSAEDNMVDKIKGEPAQDSFGVADKSLARDSREKTIMVIKHPGDQVLAEMQEEKTNYKLAMAAKKEHSLPLASATIENSSDSHFLFSVGLIRVSQLLLASLISLLIISLLINIFVRFEIQHKPVLLRTTLVLVFAVALLFINLHYLEGGVTTIYMS